MLIYFRVWYTGEKMIVKDVDLSVLEGNKYLVVVVFDIMNNQRRYNLTKFLKSYGVRVQYSVFECVVNNYYYSELCKNIVKYIDEDDKIRIYKLTSKVQIKDLKNIEISLYNKSYIV